MPDARCPMPDARAADKPAASEDASSKPLGRTET
jgi:hypothetical protein